MLALLISVFVYGVLGVLGEWSSGGVHDCAQLSFQGHHAQYQVTDGDELLTSLWDKRRQLVACSLDEDAETVKDFLSHCQRKRQDGVLDFGFGGFTEARMACLIFLSADTSGRRGGSREQHVRVKRGFTYPGTLWCGAGNNAVEKGDLGEHKETDSCCRTHDHCEHVIHPFTYSYGYRNYFWHTISHCECDDKFKDCLRKVNDTASRVVGQAFFNVIQVQCFELAFKEQCVERHWYGWCKKYENESLAVPRESGLYDYGGKLIDKPLKPKDKEAGQVPSLELPPGQPTLGQVMQATEDLLKIMVTISPTTSPDQMMTEKTPKKNKDKKQKERKNKKGKGQKGKGQKGKGLKGKRKNQLNNDNIKSPSKDIWGEEIVKNERGSVTNRPVDSILDLGHRQDPFNDILNDEPMRNVDSTITTVTPIVKHETFKATTPSVPPEPKPCSAKPKRQNKKEGKDRRERRKKPKKSPCVPAGI
ncbi:protein PROCA1 [Eleutherodactylus coqui]|uniref:protein PROCA1 n=1 Tax=Eleutherodactylus coqui TaxID=57060 RepID=UPI0034627EE3